MYLKCIKSDIGKIYLLLSHYVIIEEAINTTTDVNYKYEIS